MTHHSPHSRCVWLHVDMQCCLQVWEIYVQRTILSYFYKIIRSFELLSLTPVLYSKTAACYMCHCIYATKNNTLAKNPVVPFFEVAILLNYFLYISCEQTRLSCLSFSPKGALCNSTTRGPQTPYFTHCPFKVNWKIDKGIWNRKLPTSGRKQFTKLFIYIKLYSILTVCYLMIH